MMVSRNVIGIVVPTIEAAAFQLAGQCLALIEKFWGDRVPFRHA